MALLTPEQTLSQLKMMEDRWASMRSHPRATASLRLRLEWDEGEARRTANGLTVDVSHSGCMAAFGADPPPHRGEGLGLPQTGRWAPGRVVWGGDEAWEMGVALTDTQQGFRGGK